MPIGNKAYPVKKGITNGKPTHVPNKDGGMYGDYTKKSVDEGATGPGRKNILRQMPIK